MELMNEIVNIEKRVQSILGNAEKIKENQEDKIKRKVEQYLKFAENKARKRKEQKIRKETENQEKIFIEIEMEFYERLQKLKSIFAINKDKWVLDIFKNIVEE